MIFAAAVSMPRSWPRAFAARGLSVCGDELERKSRAPALAVCPRSMLSFAAGLAACALVPLSGVPMLPLPTVCVWPLLALSFALGSSPRRCAAVMAIIGIMLGASDLYIMQVGVPGERYSPEALAMISRLPSIGTVLPEICVLLGACSAAAAAARISAGAPCCRSASLALAELAVLTIPADSSHVHTPPASIAVDLAGRAVLSCALFFLLDRFFRKWSSAHCI